MMKFKVFPIVLVLIFYLFITFAQNYQYTQNNDGSRTFHEGSLMVKRRMYLFLTVKGDSYEMGFAIWCFNE